MISRISRYAHCDDAHYRDRSGASWRHYGVQKLIVLVTLPDRLVGDMQVSRHDSLALANAMDECWHEQPRSFEREAVTRFWGLLSLPARILDPQRPRKLLRGSTVLRNLRFKGETVRSMFFADKDFTEVDALFLHVGSSLGHPRGDDAWVVEVERKSAKQQSDYYLAIQRARKFAELLTRQFHVRARPVVIYEDDGGKYSYQDFDGEVLLIRMSVLRARTQGLFFPSLNDLPGLACDKTLVKLALLRQLVSSDPNLPAWYQGPLGLAREVEQDLSPLNLPLVGHQDTGQIPDNLHVWLTRQRETDDHLVKRIERYLSELHSAGVLEQCLPVPRLSFDGGDVVLRLMSAEREDPA